jgi:hypothetical protein
VDVTEEFPFLVTKMQRRGKEGVPANTREVCPPWRAGKFKKVVAAANPPLTPALLRLDPMFEPLRKDPRFQKLVKPQP